MRDHLFSMGVIEDEDRPRQHRPTPVRCLEAELVGPVFDARPRCSDCGLLQPLMGEHVCKPCERERQLARRNARMRKASHDDRAERIIEQRIKDGGWVAVATKNRHIIERLVQAGRARWLSVGEQTQLGLHRFDAVAGPPANRTKTG